MENASKALMMGFAMLIFVIAISILFNQLAFVKEVSDTAFFYQDKTNFYTYIENENERIVEKDVVISTLYRCTKGGFTVIIKDQIGNETVYDVLTIEDSNQFLNMVREFINNCPEGTKFKEEFLNFRTGGKYKTEEDGTEIIVKPGSSRVVVIYTEE